MAKPNTIYKMTILTMLDKVDFPLSNTQIANFFLLQEYTDYFTVQQVIHELLDSKLIRFESSHNSTQYHITPLGKETLNCLEEKMSPAIEQDITDYFEKNQIAFRNENSVTANYYKSSGNGYDVRCKLQEKQVSVIDLTIHVATKPQAKAVCQNWQAQNMDICSYLMDMLIR